jgi:hypothetical protein
MVFFNFWRYKDGCLIPVFDDKQDAYPTCKRGGLELLKLIQTSAGLKTTIPQTTFERW